MTFLSRLGAYGSRECAYNVRQYIHRNRKIIVGNVAMIPTWEAVWSSFFPMNLKSDEAHYFVMDNEAM